YPAMPVALFIGKCRIESRPESVRMIDADLNLVKVIERWQNNLRGKRQRCRHRPRREGSIVRAIRYAPRNIVKKFALQAIDRHLSGSGALAGSQSPTHFTVTFEAEWISLGVLAMRVGRAARVLEIIQPVLANESIFDFAKVDPNMRELMNE